MRRLWYGLGLVLLLWTVASAATLVQPGERAVVRRFGRILQEKPGAGLFIGLPWGMDRVERIPLGRERRVVVGYSGDSDAEDQAVMPMGQVLTGDHNLVNVKAEILYSVVAEDVEKFAVQADRADRLVARAAEASLNEWIVGRSIDDVLLRGKQQLPELLKAGIQKQIALYHLGLEIRRVTIANLDPPDDVKDAFDRLAKALNTSSTQINMAVQEANRKKREAEGDVVKLSAQAAAYASEERLQAQAEAASFRLRLEKYRLMTARDPDSLNVLWQDEMTRLYARMRDAGRIDVLDHFLTGEGLNITQFPLLPKKK